MATLPKAYAEGTRRNKISARVSVGIVAGA
jgi:hypothetical protein